MENNNSTLPLLHIISLVNYPFFININRDDILSRSFNDIGNTSHPTDEKFTKSLEKITSNNLSKTSPLDLNPHSLRSRSTPATRSIGKSIDILFTSLPSPSATRSLYLVIY